MSLTREVPAAVPLLAQSSVPCAPSLAVKKTRLLTSVKLAAPEDAEPGLISRSSFGERPVDPAGMRRFPSFSARSTTGRCDGGRAALPADRHCFQAFQKWRSNQVFLCLRIRFREV